MYVSTQNGAVSPIRISKPWQAHPSIILALLLLGTLYGKRTCTIELRLTISIYPTIPAEHYKSLTHSNDFMVSPWDVCRVLIYYGIYTLSTDSLERDIGKTFITPIVPSLLWLLI